MLDGWDTWAICVGRVRHGVCVVVCVLRLFWQAHAVGCVDRGPGASVLEAGWALALPASSPVTFMWVVHQLRCDVGLCALRHWRLGHWPYP